jgi:hypothetical protein
MDGTPKTARKRRYIDIKKGLTREKYQRGASWVILVTVETKSWRGVFMEFCQAFLQLWKPEG